MIVKNKYIYLRRLLSVSIVILVLLLVGTTPVFSMRGSDGVVVSFLDEKVSELAHPETSFWYQNSHYLINPPPAFYESDPISECPSSFEEQAIFFINHERNLAGLPPLELDVRLQIAARWMSDDMAAHENVPVDHVDSLGRTFDVRVTEEGGYPYIHLGEVIAGGFSSPEAVVQAWMNSPGHKARLLDPDYKHIGVGFTYALDAAHRYYWTADLGSTTQARKAPFLDCDPRFYLFFFSHIQK
jgi:uncharacterized protein YkwD